MLILLFTIFFKNSTLNSAAVDIAMCSTSLEVTSLKRCSQSFKGSRAQSGPSTALIGYLNVLLEYLDFFKFLLAGNLRGLPETPGNPPSERPWL